MVGILRKVATPAQGLRRSHRRERGKSLSRIGRRLLPAFAGLGLVAGLALPAVLATASPANAAPTCGTSLVCATTDITNDAAVGGDGEYTGQGSPGGQALWAYDNYTRTLIINQDPTQSDCDPISGFNLTTKTCYLATIEDQGTAVTIAGRLQPNQGSNVPFTSQTTSEQTGAKIGSPTETIPFSGEASYLFWATTSTNEPNSANVPSSHDFSNQPDDSVTGFQTQNWYEQAFPDHSSSNLSLNGLQNTWSWTYTDGCSTGPWTDSFGNNNGQSSPNNIDGNIVGGTNCPSPSSSVITVTNPGPQTTVDGNSATLQISASDSLNRTLSYSASGLPSGLSINSSTGLISGNPGVVGSSAVTVTVSDGVDSTSVTFTWTVTAITLTSPTSTTYGDEVNGFGNGFDVYQQHFSPNTPIVGWPATQGDPATHFLLILLSDGNWSFEAAPFGTGDGLCISNPGNNLLVLRNCNGSVWQQFRGSGSYIISVVSNGYVNPSGKGGQLSVGSSPVSWGGSKYSWVNFTSLP